MKKIMFNDKYGLTNAVLNGYKTMTRRILNPTMLWERIETMDGWDKEDIRQWKEDCKRRLYEAKGEKLDAMLKYALEHSPFKVGEVIAIAQSYSDIFDEMVKQNRGVGEEQMNFHDKWYGTSGWNNKMFVKSELMPHRIEITNVRLERLQDISVYDVLCEGIACIPFDSKYYVCEKSFETPQEAFAYLIDKISGNGTWNSNPWVYVYNFKLIDKK